MNLNRLLYLFVWYYMLLRKKFQNTRKSLKNSWNWIWFQIDQDYWDMINRVWGMFQTLQWWKEDGKILMGSLLRLWGEKYYMEWDSRWDVVVTCWKTSARVSRLFLVEDVEILVFDRLKKHWDKVWYTIRSYFNNRYHNLSKSLVVVAIKSNQNKRKTLDTAYLK